MTQLFYCNVPKFSDTLSFCCNHSNICTKRTHNSVMCPKKQMQRQTEDHDKTAPKSDLGLHCL